jgi:hypothetical protein
MESPRFLIAKYIPDVFRNEPRNIGVVLWSPDGILARFIGEKPDALGEVDDSQIPPFIASHTAYKQWVRYWRDSIAKESLRPRGGSPAPRTSPAFLDALRQTGPSNYVLAGLSLIFSPVPAEELPQALDYLFENYVAERPVRPKAASAVGTATVETPRDATRERVRQIESEAITKLSEDLSGE